ncbi:MAG: ABC transporter ATP-binding protein, partial [Dolichospermum sp.]
VSAQILQELTRLCREENMGLLLISHDLAMVGEYCDRIGVMYQGKIVEMGKTETVFAHPSHKYTQSLLKAALYIQQEEGKENGEQEKLNQENPILKITELKQHYTIEPNFIERIFKGEGQTVKAVDGINLE